MKLKVGKLCWNKGYDPYPKYIPQISLPFLVVAQKSGLSILAAKAKRELEAATKFTALDISEPIAGEPQCVRAV